MDLPVGTFLLPTHMLQIFLQMKTEAKTLEKMAISSNLGFIVGPALAGILGATVYGEALPVLAALILSLVVLVVIVFTLKETKRSILMEIPEKKMSEDSFHLNLKRVLQNCKP